MIALNSPTEDVDGSAVAVAAGETPTVTPPAPATLGGRRMPVATPKPCFRNPALYDCKYLIAAYDPNLEDERTTKFLDGGKPLSPVSDLSKHRVAEYLRRGGSALVGQDWGVWVPQWALAACDTPAEALVFSLVLYFFDAGRGQVGERVALVDSKGFGEPRARVPYAGHYWWATSLSRLARRLLLPLATIADALRALEHTRHLIVTDKRVTADRETELLIRTNHEAVATAYLQHTEDEVAEKEWNGERLRAHSHLTGSLHGERKRAANDRALIGLAEMRRWQRCREQAEALLKSQGNLHPTNADISREAEKLLHPPQASVPKTWFESETRRRAMGHVEEAKIQGTWIPAAVLAAVRGRDRRDRRRNLAGLALLLAQIVYMHGPGRADRDHCATHRDTRSNKLFARLPQRRLAWLLAQDPKTICRWRKTLERLGLVVMLKTRWANRETAHLRINEDALMAAINANHELLSEPPVAD